MIKRLSAFVLSDSTDNDVSIAEWAFQSHYWIEEYAGYYRCKWCNTIHSGMIGITKDFPLCRGNYAVQKLLLGKHLEEETK